MDKTHKVYDMNGFVGSKVTFVRSPGAIDKQTKRLSFVLWLVMHLSFLFNDSYFTMTLLLSVTVISYLSSHVTWNNDYMGYIFPYY